MLIRQWLRAGIVMKIQQRFAVSPEGGFLGGRQDRRVDNGSEEPAVIRGDREDVSDEATTGSVGVGSLHRVVSKDCLL